MKIDRIEHIGIAVKSIDQALAFYEGVLGLQCYKQEIVEEQHVKTAFLQLGNVKIELLESTWDQGPVAQFIAKRGEGIHHIAYRVESTQEALQEALDKGLPLIDQTERDGADNMKIGFVHPKGSFGVLTEFCSEKVERT
ncbi:MAG: methylmalonyl-CoA epimerase [Bacteroidetes bacterium]|nr:methylmalonyl-CoA epimerase [Bacteroidota bacterium]